MNTTLELWRRASRWPGGNRIFSMAVGVKAPYFATIRPRVTVVEPHRAELVITRRRRVTNHLGSVHAIALCNGLEGVAALLAEATVPADKRWVPRRMTVDYTAKASGNITCIATTPDLWDSGQPELAVAVRGIRADGTTVIEGTITLWITDRRPDGHTAAGHRAA